jgi:hypothetical protein
MFYMRYSKFVMVSLPVFLAGCSDFFGDDSDGFHTGSAVNPAPVAAPVHPAPPAPPAPGNPGARAQAQQPCPTDCGCPGSDKPGPKPIPSSALPTSGAPTTDTEWQPSEHQLVIAGDIIRELEHKNKGVKPSRTVMSSNIQSVLALTPAQTDILLTELGQ